VVVWCYPTPSERWERGENSDHVPRSGPKVKNGSGPKDGTPERLGCGTVKEEASQILQRVSAGATRRFLPFYPA